MIVSCTAALAVASATQLGLANLNIIDFRSTPWDYAEGTMYLVATVAVFVAARLGGQVAWFGFRSKETFFFEDFLKDCLMYAALGSVAAVTAAVSMRFIGGYVPPTVSAMALHVTMLVTREEPGSSEPEY